MTESNRRQIEPQPQKQTRSNVINPLLTQFRYGLSCALFSEQTKLVVYGFLAQVCTHIMYQ